MRLGVIVGLRASERSWSFRAREVWVVCARTFSGPYCELHVRRLITCADAFRPVSNKQIEMALIGEDVRIAHYFCDTKATS